MPVATVRTEMPWWTGLRWALPLLVVAPMLALAAALGTDAIIFPEGAAVAMGVWVLGLPGWAASRWRVAVLPPLCALVGVLLTQSDLPTWLAALAGTAAALVVLQVCDSRLAPALSAAVLPIVFGVRAWSYPLAVLVVCAAVVAAMPWLERRGEAPSVRAAEGSGRYPWPIVTGAGAVIAAWILAGGELLALSAAALAPPLFVSALEWLGQRAECTPLRGLRRWTVLVGAALAGSAALALVPVAWLAGCLAVAVTLALMRAIATAHPPALAIALIPQILEPPARDPVGYTLAIAAGAGALFLATYAVATVLARGPEASADSRRSQPSKLRRDI